MAQNIPLLVTPAVCGLALSCSRRTPRVSIPRRLFWIAQRNLFRVSQYTAAFIVSPRGRKSTRRGPFLSQKTVAMIFLVDVDILNFFADGEWAWRHCIDCRLVSGVW
jgi:hypothetical protein